MTRVIDVFNHILPARCFDRLSQVIPDKGKAKRIGSIALLHDVEARMRVLKGNAIDMFRLAE